jgi:hypothetical protein
MREEFTVSGDTRDKKADASAKTVAPSGTASGTAPSTSSDNRSGTPSDVQSDAQAPVVEMWPASLEHISTTRAVDEGVLIALTAIRMAVKNHIIVGALRDDRPYLPGAYIEVAREEVAELAQQNDDLAARLKRRALARADQVHPNAHDVAESQRSELLRHVYTNLAKSLRAVGDNSTRMAELVESARQDAWSEIRQAWHLKLADRTPVDVGPDYERHREGRLLELIYIDLAALRHDAKRRLRKRNKA